MKTIISLSRLPGENPNKDFMSKLADRFKKRDALNKKAEEKREEQRSWFDELSDEAQEKYLEEHPGSQLKSRKSKKLDSLASNAAVRQHPKSLTERRNHQGDKSPLSTSAPAQVDVIKQAKNEVADYAKQIAALQKKMRASQKIIDAEAARLQKAKDKADAAASRGAAKDVLFLGVKGDGTKGKPTPTFTIASRFAMGRGKVYAIKGPTKTKIAYWDSLRDGKPVKGFVLHFTKAGLKYKALNK
jgi:hypothetical protein